MLKDTMREDMKTAMKAGDAVTKGTVSMLLAAIKNRELDKRGRLAKSDVPTAELDAASALTDEEVIEVLGTEIKKRKEAITTYEAAGRAELAAGEKAELAALSKYLPEQMDEGVVIKLIAEAKAATGAFGPKEMGKVMAAVAPKVKGRFPGDRLAELVKQALS